MFQRLSSTVSIDLRENSKQKFQEYRLDAFIGGSSLRGGYLLVECPIESTARLDRHVCVNSI